MAENPDHFWFRLSGRAKYFLAFLRHWQKKVLVKLTEKKIIAENTHEDSNRGLPHKKQAVTTLRLHHYDSLPPNYQKPTKNN